MPSVSNEGPRDVQESPRRRVRWFVAASALLLVVLAASVLVLAELWLQASHARSLYREVRRRPPHPFLQVQPSGQVDHVNADGFRGDPVTLTAEPGTFRIFAIGGSTTLGVANPYQESYPFLLESLLRQRHPGVRIEVQNAGSAWYTSAHDLVAYEVKVRRFKPNLVIFFEAINDLARSFSPPWLAFGDFKPDYSHYLGPLIGFAGPEVKFTGQPSPWLTWNYVRRFVRGEPDPRSHRDPDNVARLAASMRANDKPSFQSLPMFREYVSTLVRAVQADGPTLFLASQASLYRSDLSPDESRLLFFSPILCADGVTYPSTEAMITGMRLFNDAARDIAAARGVRFLDFDAAVPKTAAHFTDDVHLTRAGNEILARVVADAIDAEGLIERAKSPSTR
jgi:lysophospholipase L1-like esterase